MSEIDVAVEGFIATEPSTGTTQAGKPYMNISVAHTERRLNKQTNQWEDALDQAGQKITTWVRATFWEEEATQFAGQLSKGQYVILRGKGRAAAYSAQDGTARAQLEVHRPQVAVVLRKQSQERGQGGFNGGTGQGQGSWAQPPANGAPGGAQGGGFSDGFGDGQPF